MATFELVVPVAAAPDRLWSVLADVRSLPRLTPSMTAVRVDPPGPLGPGSRVTITQPRLGTATWQVTEFEPGRSFAWVSARPGVATTGRHAVDPAPGGGSQLRLSIEHRGPLAPVAGALFGRLTRRYLELEAAGLARAAEAG